VSAGYSGTPLWRKLGVKEGAALEFVHAPAGFDALVAPLPEGAQAATAGEEVDVAVLFVTAEAPLRREFAALVERIAQAGGLWVAWPKRSSGVQTDLTENLVREIGLLTGLVDNKVCAIDETWSGLRFVRRLADRR
jgi:hypothetical protein